MSLNTKDLPAVDNDVTALKLRMYMKKNRMDAFDLAWILGMRTTSSIYSWTQGRHLPSLDYMIKLAYIFGVTVEELTGYTGENTDELQCWR